MIRWPKDSAFACMGSITRSANGRVGLGSQLVGGPALPLEGLQGALEAIRLLTPHEGGVDRGDRCHGEKAGDDEKHQMSTFTRS